MPLPTVDCGRCSGAGTVMENRNLPASTHPEIASQSCSSCNGYGVISKNHRPFKSQANADRYRKGASRCFLCHGEGAIVWAPTEQHCYQCRGKGNDLGFDPSTDLVVPDDVDAYKHASQDFLGEWLKATTFRVVRQDRSATWNEAHLGIGSLWSVIDYGDAWKGSDQELIDRVRGELSRRGSVQIVSLMDTNTRQIATEVVILLHRQGYLPVAMAAQRAPLLPTTYTSDVLNAPAFR